MYNPDEKGFSTNQIHAAKPEPVGPAPLATPIYQTSTYIFADTQQGAARFAGEEEGYIYTVFTIRTRTRPLRASPVWKAARLEC